MVPRPANLGQPLKGLSKINTIQVKRVSNIYFLFIGETDDRDTSARPTMREVGWFQRSRGCCLATQNELKVGPFARQEVLCRSGSLLIAQGGEGLQTQLPGVQVAVWLDLAEPIPEIEFGRVQSS